MLASIVEKDEKYNQMEKEVTELTHRYKKLQAKLISDSPIYTKNYRNQLISIYQETKNN